MYWMCWVGFILDPLLLLRQGWGHRAGGDREKLQTSEFLVRESSFTGRGAAVQQTAQGGLEISALGATQGTPGQGPEQPGWRWLCSSWGSGELPDPQTCPVVLSHWEAGVGMDPLGVGALQGMAKSDNSMGCFLLISLGETQLQSVAVWHHRQCLIKVWHHWMISVPPLSHNPWILIRKEC